MQLVKAYKRTVVAGWRCEQCLWVQQMQQASHSSSTHNSSSPPFPARVACHYGDTEAELSSTLSITSGAVFNKVLLFMLKEADGIFR
jgi:hypothetical protein